MKGGTKIQYENEDVLNAVKNMKFRFDALQNTNNIIRSNNIKTYTSGDSIDLFLLIPTDRQNPTS